MKITIRKAEIKDIEALLVFEQALIGYERPMDTALRKEKIIYYDIPTLIKADNSEIFVACDENLIMGCGYGKIRTNESKFIESKQGYIGFIYVKDEYRGKGISKIIIEHIINWFMERNIKDIRLEVYQENHSAIKAYKKIGFAKQMIEMRYIVNLENSAK